VCMDMLIIFGGAGAGAEVDVCIYAVVCLI
jgi:hypothetical protein